MVVFESLGKLKFYAKKMFVDFFPKFFFRLRCAARQAIAKHMENYSFYKSSFSPLNDEIKLSRADSSHNTGEAADGFKSNNPNFSFVGIIECAFRCPEVFTVEGGPEYYPDHES